MVTEKITQIKGLLKARKTIEARKMLDELDEELEKLEKLQTFFDETKAVVRNLGKSNMISRYEIDEVINNYER